MADANLERPLISLRDLSNYRESPSSMPDSPTENKVVVSQPPPMSPVTSVPASSTTSRPLSTGSSVSGINGVHSPHSSLNGRTPSPTLMGGGSASQQLPPACGARQLSKLKRFLTTLMQFGSDISPDIGERVRGLVLALVNSHLSIEEFHAKLQEATNFPLRPFVIPFLKANLPLLQRELLHCARLAKQTPQQYLAHNEHILFDPANSPIDTQDFAAEINENGKRRSPDRPKENGVESPADLLHPSKRPAVSPGGSSRISPGMSPFGFHGGPIRLEDISRERELRERERLERERLERERLERERHNHYNTFNYHRPDHFDRLDRIDDEWRNVENMLHSILGMVDKCRRALAVLQERTQRDREELALWMRRHHEGLDHDIKKRSDLMATTLRQTEDRVSEVKRRAEEAVNEVKRQAVSELQKAVAAAETKATEMVTAERVKMERSIADAKKQAHDEVLTTLNSQEDSSESCWNCGRKASETCSGCNVARYCGSFCQHKDWETHHRVCGQGLANRRRAPSTISTPLPATSGDSSANATTVTPSPPTASVPSPANSSNSRSGSRSSTPSEPAKQELVTR